MTGEGNAYTRQGTANAWERLRKRIHRQGVDVSWWLPVKHVRKTAAQMVRDVSDGEVAGVILSHGNPVASDDLADAYSNRPFHRVAQALREVRETLTPMFNAAPDAFTSSKLGRGA